MENLGYLAFLISAGFYSGKLLVDVLKILFGSLVSEVYYHFYIRRLTKKE